MEKILKCGFEPKDCTKACKYYETCTRNPYKEKERTVRKPHGSSPKEV